MLTGWLATLGYDIDLNRYVTENGKRERAFGLCGLAVIMLLIRAGTGYINMIWHVQKPNFGEILIHFLKSHLV